MADRRIVLKGGRLIDIDTNALRQADIVVRGHTIVDIVPPGEGPTDAAIIDVSDRIMHAGLVNAHTHCHGALGRGGIDNWTLELLLAVGPSLHGGQSLEDMQLSATLNGIEMILKGCTSCYDLYLELPYPSLEGMQAVAAGYRRAGMKATVAPMVTDIPFYKAIPGLAEALPPSVARAMESRQAQPAASLVSRLGAIYSQWRHDSVVPAVAPSIPLYCSTGFFCDCVRLGDEFGLCVHSHIAESKVQTVASMERFGGTIVSHLSKIGALTPRFAAAHAIWLTDDDMRIMADSGALVVHSPGANMRLGSGIADVRKMLDFSIGVGIGTDGSNCSDNQNMYEAMRLASLVSKAQSPDVEDWVSAIEAARAATIGGARLLGKENEIGRLAVGYRADIVFLDAHHPNWIPINNAVNQLVHAEDGSGVVDVMIDGDFVVRNRRVLGIDLADLARQAENARDRLNALKTPAKQLADDLAGIVGRFCPGLARRRLPVNRYLAHARDYGAATGN